MHDTRYKREAIELPSNKTIMALTLIRARKEEYKMIYIYVGSKYKYIVDQVKMKTIFIHSEQKDLLLYTY